MSSKRQLSPKQRKKKLTSCNRIVLNFIVAMCRELQAKEARSETYAWFQIYSMRYVCLGRNSINIWKFKRAYNNSFNGRRKQTKRSSRWAMQKKSKKLFHIFTPNNKFLNLNSRSASNRNILILYIVFFSVFVFTFASVCFAFFWKTCRLSTRNRVQFLYIFWIWILPCVDFSISHLKCVWISSQPNSK